MYREISSFEFNPDSDFKAAIELLKMIEQPVIQLFITWADESKPISEIDIDDLITTSPSIKLKLVLAQGLYWDKSIVIGYDNPEIKQQLSSAVEQCREPLKMIGANIIRSMKTKRTAK